MSAQLQGDEERWMTKGNKRRAKSQFYRVVKKIQWIQTTVSLTFHCCKNVIEVQPRCNELTASLLRQSTLFQTSWLWTSQ